MQPSIVAENISYQYQGGNWGLREFSFQALPKDFCLLTGASGSGKSTLVRCLSGLIPHLYRGRLKGRVAINGLDTAENPMWKITTQVGVVLQNPLNQFLADTVRNEIFFSLRKLPLTMEEMDARTDEVVAFFQLSPLLSRDPRTLSGGEQQRVILACHLARRPAVLILDEPFSMLDYHMADQFFHKVQALADQGKTLIIFEHRLGLWKKGRSRTFTLQDQSPPRPQAALPALSFLKGPPSFRIETRKVTVTINEQEILHDISLSFTNGEIVALLGPNGAGKTTFLRALAGLQSCQGKILVTETPAGNSRLDLGFVFQNPDLQLFNPTVRQELLYGLKGVEEKVYREIISFLKLETYNEGSPLLLSEGEKKRLSLGIALLRRPRHGFLLDEPTFGQDEVIKEFCGEVLRSLARQGFFCLIATHDLAWARKYASRFIICQKGLIVHDGPEWDDQCW
jgi:energy-coupling factor transporter ATP-binding protein EcfA2